MSIKDYFQLIFGVLKDLRVIGTVIICLLIVEFARFITTYRKRPARPRKQKAAPAPAQTESAPAEETEESDE